MERGNGAVYVHVHTRCTRGLRVKVLVLSKAGRAAAKRWTRSWRVVDEKVSHCTVPANG